MSMNNTNLQTYKDYTIWIKHDGMFYAEDRLGVEVASASTLKAVQDLVDKLSKTRYGQNVFYGRRFGSDPPRKARITSLLAKTGWDRKPLFRIQFEDNAEGMRWTEANASELIKDNEANNVIIEKIIELDNKVQELHKEVNELFDKLERYTDAELVGEEAK